MPHFFRGRTLSMQMVDHLFIDVTLLKRPIVYLESGRPLQTTTAEGVDMNNSGQLLNINLLLGYPGSEWETSAWTPRWSERSPIPLL